MKVVILGATGRTGRCLVQQGLTSGHELSALARHGRAFDPRIRVVAGSVLESPAVDCAIEGQDAALWAIDGPDALHRALLVRRRPPDLCAKGTRNVLDAMGAHGVHRLVAVTSWGTGDSRRRMPALFRFFIVPLFLEGELVDKERQEAVIRRSRAVWTIVRPSRLTDGARTGSYRIGPELTYSLGSSVSRADLAEFMLRQLSDPTWVHATVEITS